jgi:hypothetical protein
VSIVSAWPRHVRVDALVHVHCGLGTGPVAAVPAPEPQAGPPPPLANHVGHTVVYDRYLPQHQPARHALYFGAGQACIRRPWPPCYGATMRLYPPPPLRTHRAAPMHRTLTLLAKSHRGHWYHGLPVELVVLMGGGSSEGSTMGRGPAAGGGAAAGAPTVLPGPGQRAHPHASQRKEEA